MSPHPSPRSALRRGRITIVAIATATCFLTFAAASRADAGSVYLDNNGNLGAGQGFFSPAGITGKNNEGVDIAVMPHLTVGNGNVAMGTTALGADESGNYNTAIGFEALMKNLTGDSNVALGSGAGHLTTGSDNVDIANDGVANESKAIRIGTDGTQKRAFIAGVRDATASNGVPVLISPNGKLGTVSTAKTAASKSGTDRRFARMEAEMKHLQGKVRRLQAKVDGSR
jgi:hypothetical protein